MDDQLKILFDYTKFHIGMYVTLLGALVGILGKKELRVSFRGMVWWLMGCAVCLLVAGAAGGLVASSIPYFTKFDCFAAASLGPWKYEWINALMCTHVEHTSFWLGILAAVVGALVVAWRNKAA